jgi:hypothetical protein
MKSDQHNSKEKKLDKATAILSLLRVAKDKNKTDLCFTAEEMAVLIENGYSGDELTRRWQHLQSCDICYKEWVLLKTSAQKDKKRGRLYHLSLPTKLSYIGSALAAAASIVVFLNIYTPPGSLLEKQVIHESQILQQMDEVDSSLKTLGAVESDAEKKEDISHVVPIEPPLPEAESSFSAPMKTALPPPLAKEKKRAERGVAKLQNSIVGGAVFRPPVLEKWLESLEKECRSGRKDMLFWVDARNQGEKLMAHHDTFSTLFSLVRQVKDEASIEQQCVEILAELEEIQSTP